MFSGFSGVLGQTGLNSGDLWAFLKGTGLLGILAGLAILIIRFKVIRLVAVDQATEWIRTKWHVAQYHRHGAKRGRLVRLKAGRHLIVRGVYDGWEVSLKEVAMELSNVTQPYRGRMLMFDRITVGYQVIAPDTPKGDRMMLRSVLSVRDTSRNDGESQNLDQKVRGITLSSLGQVLAATEPDPYGLPLVRDVDLIKATARRLKKRHGVRLVSFEASAPAWVQGQQQYDAALLIASVMGGDDSSSLPASHTVVKLPTVQASPA